MSRVPSSGRDAGQGLAEWLRGPVGAEVLAAEREALDRLLINLFGYHLVQVGAVGDADLLASSRVMHRAILERRCGVATPAYPCILGLPEALPLASDSVDVVVLPHVLEFEPSPHEALREVERVLIPEGHLLLTGFNPWSLMGLAGLVPRVHACAPWSGVFIGLTRMRDWLALLGLDVVTTHSLFFRTPFGSERWMERLRPLDRVGARLVPYLGGVYVVLARKRVVTLTPIKPRWRPNHGLIPGGLAEPTARTPVRCP